MAGLTQYLNYGEIHRRSRTSGDQLAGLVRFNQMKEPHVPFPLHVVVGSHH